MRQLTLDTQKKLQENLWKKIRAAEEHLVPLQDLTDDLSKKKLSDLTFRMNQLKMSVRLVLNTGWIKEDREGYIKALRERLDTEEVKGDDRKLLEIYLAKMKRAKNCKRDGCWGRGYTGLNQSTGEFVLCSCTLNTIHLHNLERHDSAD
jgi:hypothetical protein